MGIGDIIAYLLLFGPAVLVLIIALLLVLRPLVAAIQRATERRLEAGAGKRHFLKKVFPTELRYLTKRRGIAQSEPPGSVEGKAPSAERNLVGLAISGGGIRSATVGLGVLQALQARGIFRHIDYLSTVSGGGFIGGCLTSFLSGKARRGSRSPGRFPFEHRRQEGEEPAVEYLRNHANYLAPSGGVDWLRMAWAWARGVFLNGLAVLPWMAFVAAAVGTLTYRDLLEVHVPHRTIAISELEAKLGKTRWAMTEEGLEGYPRWQGAASARRLSLPVTAAASSVGGGSGQEPAEQRQYALLYSNEIEKIAKAETWQPLASVWQRQRAAIEGRILPPDPAKLRCIDARIAEGEKELEELALDELDLDEHIEALVRWAEGKIDPGELALFYRAAADMEDQCQVTLDGPEQYFDVLNEEHLESLAARRAQDKKLLAALLPADIGGLPSAASLRAILGLDMREVRRIADAIRQPGEESPRCKDGVVQEDDAVRLRKRLLAALPGSTALRDLVKAAQVELGAAPEMEERLNRLATAARRQEAAIQTVWQDSGPMKKDLKKEDLIAMANRLSPFRDELLDQLALDEKKAGEARWQIGERPRPFQWSLLGPVERPEAESAPSDGPQAPVAAEDGGDEPEDSGEPEAGDGGPDESREPAAEGAPDGPAQEPSDPDDPCLPPGGRDTNASPHPAPGQDAPPGDGRRGTSVTRTTLRIAVPLLLLFGLIYLRHSGAGAPPGWKASFRVLVGLGLLALFASAAIPGFWGETTIGLVVALVLAPLALPLLERILTISDLRSRHGRRTTLAQRLRRDLRRPDAALLRRRVEALSTLALLAVAAALLVDLQKPILDWYHHHALPRPSNASLAIALGGLIVVLPILGGLPAGHRLARVAKKLGLSLVAVIGLGSMFLVYLWMADLLVYGSWRMPVHSQVQSLVGADFHILDYGILALAMLFAARELAHLINANDSSMNGFYRDRLGAAYLAGEDANGVLGPERDLELQKICPDHSGAPYHLINTALNLQASGDESLRGRKSGFFVFSRHFIGSWRTGYCSTREMAEHYGPVHLGTAMAISAAAASPNMGTLTVPGLTPLLTLLNARLGYWLPHPGRVADLSRRVRASLKRTRSSPRRWLAALGNLIRRTRLRPGGNLLWKEIFSRLDERGAAVNVSDGGHLENLGAYELLRRRCRFIFVSDAEADPGLHCGSLAALLRYARNDLGIDINIFLDDLTPDERGHTRQHAALGQILYPPTGANAAETGFLLYLKSTVTGDEDLVVREYREKQPSFPHESTADQFFTEDQFEAYRSLGFHSVQSVLGDRIPLPDFAALEEWFEELAVKLAPASGAPPLGLEVHGQLRRIEESLGRPEMAAYFHEIHPELPAAASASREPAAEQPRPTERQLVLLVNQQLQLMSEVVRTLGLSQHRSQVHPAHRGWMNLFQRWASSASFKQGYRSLITGFPTRLQFFCELVLGLELRFLDWQADRDDPQAWASLRLDVAGAAGEPLVVGRARRGRGDTDPRWEIHLEPGFDGPEMRRRAARKLNSQIQVHMSAQ